MMERITDEEKAQLANESTPELVLIYSTGRGSAPLPP